MQGQASGTPPLPPPPGPPPGPPSPCNVERARPDGQAPELQTSVLDDMDLVSVERDSDVLEEAGDMVRSVSGGVLSDGGFPSADEAQARSGGAAAMLSKHDSSAYPLDSSADMSPRFNSRPSEKDDSRKSWIAATVDPSTVPPGKEDSPAARGLLRVTNDDLQEAALRGDLGLVRRLIHAGCSVNAPMRPESDDEFMTLLHVLSSKPEMPGGSRIIGEVVRAEADLNARTSFGWTPLICACQHKHIGAVEVLLASKASLDPIDDDGHNAVCSAVLEEEALLESEMLSLEIVSLLSNQGADLNDGGDFKPITEAVKQQNDKMVSLLLRLGAEADGLHEAVQYCPLKIIKSLTEAEANPFSKNSEGKVVMDIALQRGDQDVLVLLRDYIGDLQRKQHRHLKTLQENAEDEDGDDGEEVYGVGRQASCHRGASHLGPRKSFLEIMQPRHFIPETRFAREIKTCRTRAKQFNKNKYFQWVMFATLLVALFMPDIWVIFDIVEDLPLDLILLGVIVLFIFEFLLQVIANWKNYLGSFFFFMDLVGIVSVPLDLSWVLQVIPMIGGEGAHGGVVMRAARMVKLGVRAGRFTKLVKLLRFMPGIQSNAGGGTAKVITNTLNRTMSMQVSCCIILMVMVIPIGELVRYPTSDYSLETWMDAVAHTAWFFPMDMKETLRDVEEFYDDVGYYPYQVICTFANGTTGRFDLSGSPPARIQNDLKLRSDNGKTEMHFDFGAPNRTDSWGNVILVAYVIVVMLGSALLLSNAVSGIVMLPLENLFNGVQKTASTIFQSVAKIAHGGQDEADKDSEGQGGIGNETLLLERVLKKLSALSEITVKKTPLDADTLEGMEESDRAVLQGYSSGPLPEMNLDTANFVSEFEEDEDATDLLMTRIEDYTRDVGITWDEIDNWDFNPMELNDKQRHAVVTCVMLYYRGSRGNDHDEWMLFSNFVDAASKGYGTPRLVPYHNWYHAADVSLTMYRVLRIAATETYYSAHERFALVVSAVCHDIGHPGVNNPFLIETGHELAVLYNDHSPLENMHCSRLFELSRQPNTSIFKNLRTNTFREVRHVCIEAILHTDYQHHFTMVKEIQMFYEMNSDLFDQADEIYKASGSGEFPTKDTADFFRTSDVRRATRNVMLHYCDVSNPMKPWNQCKMWADSITNEFFSQGDKEYQLDLQVQALNDRQKVNKPYSQVGFIEFFVAPLALAMVRLIPPLQFTTGQLFDNLDTWVTEWAENSEPKPDADEHAKVLERITKLVGKASAEKDAKSPDKKHKSLAIPAMGFQQKLSKGFR